MLVADMDWYPEVLHVHHTGYSCNVWTRIFGEDLGLVLVHFEVPLRLKSSIYWMASVSSALQLVRMTMSSAKARRS
ncbi:MAG: hypothetical protein ACK559_00985, partial [bacterium]